MILLTPEVLSIIVLDIIFLIFSTIAFFLSIKLVLYWDISSTSPTQYKLEKYSYLVSTIIKYILYLKLFLFLYYIFVQDKLSIYIPGAMCAVGVINATTYGYYAIIFKIINIYLFSSWIVLNSVDMQDKKLPFTKIKFIFFILIYIFLFTEIALEIMEFYSINPAKIVSCCGVVFSASSQSIVANIFNISNSWIVSIFYVNYLLILIGYFFRNKIYFMIINILFIFTSIISLIKFFGTYIYELPTHHCPFCLLQSDYHYIGYLLYITLFMGTFSSIANFITNDKKYKKISVIFNSIYTTIVSLYVMIFYIKNGVFL